MCSPLAYLFGNFWQTIQDKIEVLLGMSLGTPWELDRNTLGIRGNNKNLSPNRPTSPCVKTSKSTGFK